jgi:hypothetical protein
MDIRVPPTKGIDEYALPVFSRSGWAKVACGNKKLVVKTVESKGVVIGRMLYIVTAYNPWVPFLRIGGNTYWTPYAGIDLDPELTHEQKNTVASELLAQLPKNVSYKFQCPSHTKDASIIRQAFINAGFTILGNKTCILRPDKPGIFIPATTTGASDDILSILDSSIIPDMTDRIKKIRPRIRRAARELDIVTMSAHDFTQFYGENLCRENKRSRQPLSVLKDVLTYGLETGNVRIFAARQKTPDGSEVGQIDAAIACASDEDRYYVWRMTVRKSAGSESTKPHAEAGKLILVHAMLDARKKNLVFDTDGGELAQTSMLYPRLGINGCEDRIIAVRLHWPLATARFANKIVKNGCALGRQWRSPYRTENSPTPK